MYLVPSAIVHSAVAAALAAVLGANSLYAQATPNSPGPATTTPGAAAEQSDSPEKPTWFEELYAPDLIGKDVVNASGDEIAQVDDIVTKSDDGDLYAVLASGGFLGLGEREVAVSLDALGLDTGGGNVVAQTLSEESLEAMPEYDEAAYQSVSQYQKLGAIDN